MREEKVCDLRYRAALGAGRGYFSFDTGRIGAANNENLGIYPGAMIVARMIATEVIESLIYGLPALRVVVSRFVVIVSREFQGLRVAKLRLLLLLKTAP